MAPTLTIDWKGFCSAIQRLIDHPVQGQDDSPGRHFDDWGGKAVAALSADPALQQMADSWHERAASPDHWQEAELIADELRSFESYVNELLERHGVSGGGAPDSATQAYMEPLDSTAVETSHSVLSTILDSLADMFPALKGLLKAGKEFIDIRTAFASQPR